MTVGERTNSGSGVAPGPDLWDPAYLRARLGEVLESAVGAGVGGVGSLSPIGARRVEVLDDTIKMLVRSRGGRPVAVLKCSPPAAPDAVANACDVEAAAREAVGTELGRVFVSPLAAGRVDGCAYAVLPYRRPLSGRLNVRRVQRLWLAPRIYGWLRGVTAATARAATLEEVAAHFDAPLRWLGREDWADADVRARAARACDRLRAGDWRPVHVLAHNDLFENNVLLAPRPWRGPGFVVIDWGGCRLAGHGTYDLIRLARSLRTSVRTLRHEVRAHCELLGCSQEDAGGYLLAALGFIGLNLDRFPKAEFVKTARSCWDTMAALGTGS